ncbi:MAG: ABC transporter permease, partial [Pseudomonadota bacterium]
RAFGAGDARLLWRHALPNALVGAAAVIGAQFAFLVSGVVVIETIFAWPGLGRLLVDATLALDFPVVQAATIAAAILVFAVNVTTDAVIDRLDVRVREARA